MNAETAKTGFHNSLEVRYVVSELKEGA